MFQGRQGSGQWEGAESEALVRGNVTRTQLEVHAHGTAACRCLLGERVSFSRSGGDAVALPPPEHVEAKLWPLTQSRPDPPENRDSMARKGRPHTEWGHLARTIIRNLSRRKGPW